MSQLTDAADAITQHVRNLEAFKFCAQSLYGLDSMENAQKEAQARLDALSAKTVDAQTKLDALNAQAAAKSGEIAQAQAQIAQAAKDSLDTTKAKCDALLADAKTQAGVITANAQTAANQ